MSIQTRYVVSLYVDIYAEDDEEAKRLAKEVSDHMNQKYYVRGKELECNPYASLELRKIEIDQ